MTNYIYDETQFNLCGKRKTKRDIFFGLQSTTIWKFPLLFFNPSTSNYEEKPIFYVISKVIIMIFLFFILLLTPSPFFIRNSHFDRTLTTNCNLKRFS